jgi:hypothetical protein
MQFFKPESYFLVRDALAQAGRADDRDHTVANPAQGRGAWRARCRPGQTGRLPTGPEVGEEAEEIRTANRL